jgi:hypothetical protein
MVHLNVQRGNLPRYRITLVENHQMNTVKAAGSRY